MDDFKPLEPGQGQADLYFQHSSFNKSYDKDGESTDFADESELSVQVIGLDLKYGLIANLDLEVSIPFFMTHAKPAGAPAQDESGIGQPEIGVKYLTTEGFGGFINFTLPLAGEKIIADPGSEIALGGLYVLETETFNFHASLSYNITLEIETSEDPKTKVNFGDQIYVSLRPQFNVTPELGVCIAGDYMQQGDGEVEGNEIKDSGSSILEIGPGVDFQASEILSIEARSSFVAMGTNTYGGWGLGAKAKVKF
jgi:hypothetical protein